MTWAGPHRNARLRCLSPLREGKTLGEAFPGCNTRGRASGDLKNPLPREQHLGKIFFKKKSLFPGCNTRGRILLFFKKTLFPECNTRGRDLLFKKKNPLPRVLILGTRGRKKLKSKKKIAISIFLTYTVRSNIRFTHRYISMLFHTTHPRAKTDTTC
jgi:hypothetical protein